MSILNTSSNWNLPISNTYRIWWQGYGFTSKEDREQAIEAIFDILDSNPDEYRKMIEVGAIHAIRPYRFRQFPEEYSWEECEKLAHKFIKTLKSKHPGCRCIQLRLTAKSCRGGEIMPAMVIRYHDTPFSDNPKAIHPKYVLYLVPIKEQYKPCSDIIPGYDDLPLVEDDLTSFNAVIQNF